MSEAIADARKHRSTGASFIYRDIQPSQNLPSDLASWLHDPKLGGVCQHETRSHMRSDLHRYLFASCFAKEFRYSPKLSIFPRKLLPNHKNVDVEAVPFEDRFRVQLSRLPSTTIVSHIAKDGHYYIHPEPSQCRSLTVREAARLQTFRIIIYLKAIGPSSISKLAMLFHRSLPNSWEKSSQTSSTRKFVSQTTNHDES